MKRKLFIFAIAAVLVALTAFGTLAFFTASHSVENKFKTAGSDNPPSPGGDEIFGIEVTEDTPDGKDTSNTGNTYENVAPGDVYTKNPTITNTGKYDQWVRVTVTFDNVANWAKADSTAYAYDKLFDKLVTGGFKSELWTAIAPEKVEDTAVYVFYLKAPLKAEDNLGEGESNSVELFNEVTVPAELDNEQMENLTTFGINVKADAIQVANTGDSAKAAFETYWAAATEKKD